PSEVGDTIDVDIPCDETPEEHERRMVATKEELDKVESEINMLRQVLFSKIGRAAELKRQLGITPFQEFKQDLQQGLQQFKSSDPYQKTNETLHQLNEKISQTQAYQKTNETLHQLNEKISQTQAYQKTTAVVKTASEKTTSAISTVSHAVVKKMGDIRNSQTFKSFDEKMHSTYANVKAKVTGSRSSGEIDEAFRDAHPTEEGAVSTPEAAEDASKIKLPEEKVPL
ncbi:unnamed protein product, partial [Candidula unifasciata]